MKVLIVSNYLYPETGAAPNRITQMAGELSKHHHVTVATAFPNYPTGKVFPGYTSGLFKKENIKGFSVRRYRTYNSISKNPLKRVLSMLSFGVMMFFDIPHLIKEKYDFIIVQNSPLLVSCFAIFYAKIFTSSKIVLNVSDLWPLSALELGAIKKGLFYSLLEKIELFNYRSACLILGQSNEILNHVENRVGDKQNFLYRNIPILNTREEKSINKHTPVKIVYAGLLGVAQGILDICKAIDFKKLGVEFHIYGKGNELKDIQDYINNSDKCIQYKGSLNSDEIRSALMEYDYSLVPLKNRIYGAVPSKIFELTLLNVPIIFCGGGEGAEIVDKEKLGFVSEPGDFKKLSENIEIATNLSNEEYKELLNNCAEAGRTKFDFSQQIENLVLLLETMHNRK